MKVIIFLRTYESFEVFSMALWLSRKVLIYKWTEAGDCFAYKWFIQKYTLVIKESLMVFVPHTSWISCQTCLIFFWNIIIDGHYKSTSNANFLSQVQHKYLLSRQGCVQSSLSLQSSISNLIKQLWSWMSLAVNLSN